MAEPFLSEITLFFGFTPKGWAACTGQLLPINQNQALFFLLGTTNGGNGQTTFGLANPRGQVPISFGNGFTLGQAGNDTLFNLISTTLWRRRSNYIRSAKFAEPRRVLRRTHSLAQTDGTETVTLQTSRIHPTTTGLRLPGSQLQHSFGMCFG